MDKVAGVTGRQYHLFDYYGASDAESIIVAIGSSTEVIGMTVDHLNAQGKSTASSRYVCTAPSQSMRSSIPYRQP